VTSLSIRFLSIAESSWPRLSYSCGDSPCPSHSYTVVLEAPLCPRLMFGTPPLCTHPCTCRAPHVESTLPYTASSFAVVFSSPRLLVVRTFLFYVWTQLRSSRRNRFTNPPINASDSNLSLFLPSSTALPEKPRGAHPHPSRSAPPLPQSTGPAPPPSTVTPSCNRLGTLAVLTSLLRSS